MVVAKRKIFYVDCQNSICVYTGIIDSMEFTYIAYESMLKALRDNDYEIYNYHDYDHYGKCAILRHDVDVSLEKALQFARLESSLNTRATYFILLSTNFYNIASVKNRRTIDEIKDNGHEIGLHFDEANYTYSSGHDIHYHIEREIRIMSDILGIRISTVSMHRPSKNTLAADYEFQDAINTYSKIFFKNFKYISDSRRNWHEPVLDIIRSKTFKRLHILTHPFWYSENGISASDVIKGFTKNANAERYEYMSENIKDLEEFMKPEDLLLI